MIWFFLLFAAVTSVCRFLEVETERRKAYTCMHISFI